MSWQEIRLSVREIRNRFSNLCKKVPSNFTFRTIQTETGFKTRIYFLSMPNSSRENTLMFADLPQSYLDLPSSRVIPWYPLLESSFHIFSYMGVVSKEEQLQWERKRLVTWGITSYEVHPESGRFIFPACGSLFTCQDSGLMVGPHFPLELKMTCQGARLNPQMCPSNPELVAYICNGDIWVQHMGFATEQRMTFVHKGAKSLVDDPICAGSPAYVTQEEFHRYSGMWWQPKCLGGVYRILYEEVDESDVEILSFVSQSSEDQGVEEFRFPRAGTPNAKSTLKMLQFQMDDTGQFLNVHILQMREPLDSICSWTEYLIRVGWTPDGNFIWAQCLDRRQVHLELVLIPLLEFVLLDGINSSSRQQLVSSIMLLRQEINADVWINVHDVLYFFPILNETVTFIWADEKTGFRHLYLITAELSCKPDVSNHVWDTLSSSISNSHDRLCQLKILRKEALTYGDWEVLDKQIWVDEKHLLVYFTGMQSGPLEKHLYVVSISAPGEIHQLTTNGFSHTVAVNKECTRFVTVYSSIAQLPVCEVYAIEWPNSVKSVHNIVVSSLGYLLEPSEPDENYRQPELFVYNLPSKESLYCMIFTPPNMQPGLTYPTVLSVYGGPEVQLVNNSFKGMRHLRLHMLASRGYIVVVIDSRGSHHRGVKFESYIKGRMGTVEIDDQVAGLQWLAAETGYIDLARVAIHGWSYGGYLSLMGLAQRPDVFKLAIAGAPVTSWNLYDTAYTERYMDLPSLNAQGYSSGSVLSYINNFPNEENRLLIIHGLIDENVHFLHTSQLINALVKAGKPYQLQVYPGERHSLRHLDASEHYETNLLSFLQQHL